ncbi:ArsR/SmtB family transcription factor [Haloarcula litorea]|uniref:ArsR/SmtB family transcription factor n=1 Tax=Haloarcula litorea TaxID=3032579 RepID=UPI0023E7D950|nr:helix-turn-helix domain-containing protein [Halomicroarcula sp. GDY20]
MSHLLPQKSPVDRPDPGSRVVELGHDDAGEVFSVLGSSLARTVLAELHRSPATQSELAERTDASIQNVGYHLDRLDEAGLVTVVDQWYSRNGAEMDVFAPTDDPLIVVASGDGQDGTVEELQAVPR